MSLASLLSKGFKQASTPPSEANLPTDVWSPQQQPLSVLAVPTISGVVPQKVPTSASGLGGTPGAPYQSATASAPPGMSSQGDLGERFPKPPAGLVAGLPGINGASSGGKVDEVGTSASGNGNWIGPISFLPGSVSTGREGAAWQESGPLGDQLDGGEERSNLAGDPQKGSGENGSTEVSRGSIDLLKSPAPPQGAAGQKKSRRDGGSSATGLEPDTTARRSAVDSNWEEAVSLLAPLRHVFISIYMERLGEEPLMLSAVNMCQTSLVSFLLLTGWFLRCGGY